MSPNPLNLSTDGDLLQALGFEIELTRRPAGELVLPTGRLVVCDPVAFPETEPFDMAVPVGTHAVHAVMATLRDEVRIAYALITFSDERPHRWEVAHLHGDEPQGWARNREGFHVDSSIAAFMDLQTADVWLDLVAHEPDELEHQIRREMRRRKRSGSQLPVAALTVDPRTQGNLVAFDADPGTYATYLGIDGRDEVCLAVVDFEVLDYQFTPFGVRL